jgi:SAM-dependent methyltransferase
MADRCAVVENGAQIPPGYTRTLYRHRSGWERKPAVRAAYAYWYAKISEALSPKAPTVELGCGCGSLKEYLPDVVATDVRPTPWCDRVVDACEMPFADSSVGNFVMVDVLHHIPRPIRALREAARTLAPGGRVVIIEPYLTLWSRVIYGGFHHEHYDLSANVVDGAEGGEDYSNMATANLLFYRGIERLRERIPSLRCLAREPLSFLAYPLTGGFRGRSWIPAGAVRPISRIEDALPEPVRRRLTAMRLFVVLERS